MDRVFEKFYKLIDNLYRSYDFKISYTLFEREINKDLMMILQNRIIICNYKTFGKIAQFIEKLYTTIDIKRIY